ncbi:MAG: hypothetical protein GTN69_05255 [Armatimonadetes bacterium]|nr:hypothetical protein [Armatimonadota bacterium]NIO75290.1 hypothetical protein [Armatimonadota bacterium]NIO95850.1 hypothetical protein [Armatimonadota bacterium]
MTFEQLFITTAVLNNLILIAIFLLRRTRNPARVKSVGRIYLLLALPALYALFLAIQQDKAIQYAVFLAIFLAFLALEWVYDFLLKVPFRKNWKLLTPYLVLYYAMNYGFVVMPWKYSQTAGIVILILFIIQLAANLSSHSRA